MGPYPTLGIGCSKLDFVLSRSHVLQMGGEGVFILFTERMDLRSHPGIFTFLINLVLFILDCRYLPDQPHPSKVRYTRVTPIAQTPR